MKDITKDRIREVVADAIGDGVPAGMSLLVLQDGKEVFYDEQGYADLEKRTPIRRDTIFRLYSMTKPVTAAAAMMLLERGQLDFCQYVSDFLPGFSQLTVEKDGEIVPAQVQMTVHHLLNMTSGLTYGDDVTKAGRQVSALLEEAVQKLHTDDAISTVELADRLGRLPLAFEPDSSWQYGLSADVLGAVIEKASGVRFGEFLRANLFEPLGMRDTDFWVPQEKRERLAKTYETVGKGEMRLYDGDNLAVSNDMERPPAYEAGGAGLVSTIDDYARFAQMLLDRGSYEGKQILAPRTVDYMVSGDLTPVQQEAYRRWVGLEGFSYSHLMRVMRNPAMATGLARMGEYGWDGWLGCYMANFPQERICLLLMQQKKDAGTIPLTRKIRNILLSGLE